MNTDVQGRVRNTKLGDHNALPLFEAIVNSIHAIEELPAGKGQIDIQIERDHSQQHLEIGGETVGASQVSGFVITDDGIGFNDENLESFQTSDSTRKVSKGGKGIGRLLWLKAFTLAEVDSTFQKEGKYFNRTFKLELNSTGVSEPITKNASGPSKTSVHLIQYKAPFSKNCPAAADIIAKRIIEHCLEYLVLSSCPQINLIDDDKSKIDLNQLFSTHVKQHTEIQPFEIAGRKFQIQHLRLGSGYEKNHKIHFCANTRAVHSENVNNKIPNLLTKLKDSEGAEFLYAGYITGTLLDDRVNNERTGFDLLDDGNLLGEPGWKEILKGATDQASSFLQPYTAQVKESKEEQIRQYVQSEAPQYRPLLKHRPASVDTIAPNLTKDKLDLELYKLQQVYEGELRETSSKLLESIEAGQDLETFEKQYERFLAEWNESGIAKLARHVVHRKATLDFLEKSRELTDKGEYKKEEAVHEIVFPLKRTSDDVMSEHMNLWIVDEKLAFHNYLSSDVAFAQLKKEIVDSTSKDRADILIFNKPSAFVNEEPPYTSVVLLEFKRPSRNNYDSEEDPIRQVLSYVKEIRSGTKKDRKGKPIKVSDHIPFYAYIIADLTPKLIEQAEYADLTPSPDAAGYFGYNASYKTYIEIVSFDKLLSDARKRNKFFFDQMSL